MDRSPHGLTYLSRGDNPLFVVVTVVFVEVDVFVDILYEEWESGRTVCS